MRENALWEKTCFEFFVAPKGSKGYWEFNLSPGGNWNVYRFESYRRGMVEESAFGSLPFHVSRRPGFLRLDLAVDLECLALPPRPLEIAVAAVIRNIRGETSYWALTHPETHPDFHQRDGFIIELD